MKYFKHILFAFSVTLFLSCSTDYLDITPKGILIPTEIADLDEMLNVRTSSDLENIELSVLTDNFTYEGAGPGSEWAYENSFVKKLYTYQSGQIYSGDQNSTWVHHYNSIFIANHVILKLTEVTVENDAELEMKKKVDAEARMIRAEKYFSLVNVYGKQYQPNSAATDLGVPLITLADLNTATPARSSVQEVYDFILSEIHEVLNNLPAFSENRQRFTKTAANALLARVYFQKEAYPQALEYAEYALQDNSRELYDYTDNTDAFPNQYWTRKDTYRWAGFTGNMYRMLLSDDYLDLYPNGFYGGTDLRTIKNIFRQYSWSSGTYYYYHVDAGYVKSSGTTVQEMMLMAAEVKARNNDLGEALTYLNQLRVKRITPTAYVALISTDQTEVLTWILEERRREIPFAGRLFELKRLNNDPRFAKEVVHKVGEEAEAFTLTIADDRYVLPVPLEVLGFNPNMQEYPRN